MIICLSKFVGILNIWCFLICGNNGYFVEFKLFKLNFDFLDFIFVIKWFFIEILIVFLGSFFIILLKYFVCKIMFFDWVIFMIFFLFFLIGINDLIEILVLFFVNVIFFLVVIILIFVRIGIVVWEEIVFIIFCIFFIR